VGTERIFLADDAATASLGAKLAATLTAGDLVLLAGGLGAGKTALARALIRALVEDDRIEVPSPSFALVQPYDGQTGPVLHADLYRLAGEREIDELGLFENARAIVIVEWPERAPDLAARADVAITLTIPSDGNGRVAEVTR
jgi:tRNA threonylcarbamoyl adenosine modification protein YjeE